MASILISLMAENTGPSLWPLCLCGGSSAGLEALERGAGIDRLARPGVALRDLRGNKKAPVSPPGLF